MAEGSRRHNKFIIRPIQAVLIILLLLVAICVIIDEAVFQVVCVLIGFLLAQLSTYVFKFLVVMNEESNKLQEENFPYDEKTHKKHLRVGTNSTHLWYLPIVINKTQDVEIKIEDHPEKHFELDSLLQANYALLMKAHRASVFTNKECIRLDDCSVKGNDIRLVTSRTDFYNDLVTNRAMDYAFFNGITVRDIYEFKKEFTPFSESRMSNHIGINALFFIGGRLVVPKRSSITTLSKMKITSTFAYGLGSEKAYSVYASRDNALTDDFLIRCVMDDVRNYVPDMSPEDFGRLIDDGRAGVYFLGFGRLVYTGGKPQFYFAAFLDGEAFGGYRKGMNPKDPQYLSGEYMADSLELWDKKSKFVFRLGSDGVSKVERSSQGLYTVRLHDVLTDSYHSVEAEKSMLVNMWHLSQCRGLKGIPDWFYDAVEAQEKT